MQDKDASQDDERVRSVNAHINRTGDAAGGDGDVAGLPPGATAEQAAMMQMMFGQQGGAAPTSHAFSCKFARLYTRWLVRYGVDARLSGSA